MQKFKLLSLCFVVSFSSCASDVQGTSNENVQSSSSVVQGVNTDSGDGALSVEAAGQTYLDIVNNVNCALREVKNLEDTNSLGDGTVDIAALPDLQRAFKVLSSEREAAVRSFVGTTWPEIVAADIETLAREWSLGARAELAISEAVDGETYTLELNRYNDLTSSPKANPGYIRSVLGIGPASETDQC